MTESEAADRLGVPLEATPPEIKRNYRSLRKQVQERLDDAPTEGLKRKYQSELQSLQQAFETLCPLRNEGNNYPTDEPSLDDENRDSSSVQAGQETIPGGRTRSTRWLLPLASALLVCVLGALAFGYVKSHLMRHDVIKQDPDPTQVSASTDGNRPAGDATSTRTSDGGSAAADQSQLQADQERQAQALKAAEDRAAKAEQDAAAARLQAAADRDAAAARQAEAERQAEVARQAEAARQQAVAEKQAEAERQAQAERDAEEARHQAEEDAKPTTGSVKIAYEGDMYACRVAIRIEIGSKSFRPTGSAYRASGVPLGEQDYNISGGIGCPTPSGAFVSCQATGSGSLDLSDGDTVTVSWANTGPGVCTVQLE